MDAIQESANISLPVQALYYVCWVSLLGIEIWVVLGLSLASTTNLFEKNSSQP